MSTYQLDIIVVTSTGGFGQACCQHSDALTRPAKAAQHSYIPGEERLHFLCKNRFRQGYWTTPFHYLTTLFDTVLQGSLTPAKILWWHLLAFEYLISSSHWIVYTFPGYEGVTVPLPCVDWIILLRLKHIYYIVGFPEMIQSNDWNSFLSCCHSTMGWPT